jgi:large subunit ribosomal protein L23
MAILKRKANTEEVAAEAEKPVVTAPIAPKDVLLMPRLSEKAVGLDKLNKYVFTVKRNANKPEIRKALEKFYGIQIARVNIVNMKGKVRRYGRTVGKTSNFKKAIVTLTKDSKKPEILQAK